MALTQIGSLIATQQGQVLIIKLIELLLKPREKNISINDIGTSEEIKTSLKIISEGIEKFPEIMNKLSEITKNIQNDQRNFINNLLDNYADKIDKEIIKEAIRADSRTTQENTKGFWNTVSIIGGISVAVLGFVAKAFIEDRGNTTRTTIEKKPFWYK